MTLQTQPTPVDSGYRSNQVVVTRIDIPFWSMVGLLVKVAIASIPAMFVVMVIMSLFFGCIAASMAALGVGFGGLSTLFNR